MTCRITTIRRRCALGVALAALLAGAFGPTALAQARPTLGLSESPQLSGEWVASGAGFAPSRSDVRLWIQNTPSWTTLEYQSNITTSRSFYYFYGGVYNYVAGGQFTAQGLKDYIAPGPGVLGGGSYYAANPLECGRSYQAVAYDPADGYVYSNVLTEPACPHIT
jgi:hypothetical protein